MKRRIAEFLGRMEHVLILSHIDPDGDAIGSALGLAWILRGSGKRAEVLLAGGVPRLYDFLPGADEVGESAARSREEPDAIAVLDATSPSRLGDLESVLGRGLPVVNLDHHPDNTRFGEICWVDPGACATALLILEMAGEGGLDVPREAAECLYAGILTDTGRFTFANTDARALAAAADLARRGADPHGIASRVYARNSQASVRLLGKALSTLDIREDGAVACLHVTKDMLAETGARPEDSDGFSTYARSIEGVKVGLFFRETEDGAVKVSLRSNEGVKINGVAGRFGGGGHPRASGARVPGPLEAAKESFVRAISEHLRGGTH